MKTGYRDALVGCYQRALHAHWQREGPGYRNAGDYLSGAQIQGNSELLAMVLGCDPQDWHPALEQVAQSVMPNGFAAFIPKPDIPTYLVGKPEEIAAFHTLVPAPNETYCHLFWPFDDTDRCTAEGSSCRARSPKARRQSATRTLARTVKSGCSTASSSRLQSVERPLRLHARQQHALLVAESVHHAGLVVEHHRGTAVWPPCWPG